MKVALIGNMNNNFFALMRYLRDKKINAHLFLTNAEQNHFLPECDTFENKYNEFIHNLEWGHPLSYFSTSSKKIKQDLNGYDFTISCGFVPAFLKKADLNIDILVPFGGDIWGRPVFESFNLKRIFINSGVRWIQKQGVPFAKIIHMGFTNELYEDRINYLNNSHIRWKEILPMIYYKEYRQENLDDLLQKSDYSLLFKKIRDENEFIALSHGRHYWYNKDTNDPAHKGNDKLIKAFAEFVNENNHIKSKLVFLEYGIDVIHSKNLINKLKIEDYVIWLPQMNRRDLMIMLLLSDIVCAEFTHSWESSGVLYEALVGAKPILAYRNDISIQDKDDLYDIMNAFSVEEIKFQLLNYINNKDHYKNMGQKGLTWFEKKVDVVISKYSKYISNDN